MGKKPPHLPRPDFVILASDGVWDVLSNQDVCDIVNRQKRDAKVRHTDNGPDDSDYYALAAKEIVETALRKNSLDNVSVLIIKSDALR